MRTILLLAGLLSGVVQCVTVNPPNSKSKASRLWYDTPAVVWNDSLPIGNGRLGGMVKGTVATELIYINEDSLWSGTSLDRLNPDAKDTIPKVQSLLAQGDVKSATFEANLGLSGVPSSMRMYQPVGDFQIYFQDQGSPSKYERWLELDDGTAGVYYEANGVSYGREYLASKPADALAIRLTASKSGALNFYIKFQRPSNQQNRFSEKAYAENSDTIITEFNSNQIKAAFGARVVTSGGTKRQIGDQIVIKGADEAWVYLDARTTVREKNPLSTVRQTLKKAGGSSYSQLRSEHVEDYQELYQRANLTLGSSSDEVKSKTTAKRRQALSDGSFDPELASLYFQYGRYLLISSSRPGTLPATLQGIWNNALDPSWGSKYTININIQMIYWPAEVTNLAELTEPLFTHMKLMHKTGKAMAQKMYGARGWVAHHNTDIWGDAAPQDIYAQGSYWPMGHAWLLQHVFDHYLYTGDKKFLEKVYYLFEDAVKFYEDFLTDYKGWKVTNPSVSPEASYKNGSTSGAMTISPTMDNSILRELFDNFAQIAKILGKSQDRLVTTAKSLRKQLRPLEVSNKTGLLMEWVEDFQEDDPGHRHLSPLYGLYPGSEITPKDEEIWQGSKELVDRRNSHGAGNIGWSRAWLTALRARLHQGKELQSDLTYLLYNLTYDSLLDMGPPAGFQMDGNLGGCAAIAESVLSSHSGLIQLLPALMPSSKEGKFEGFVARGGFVVDAEWKDGGLTSTTITSKLGNALNVTVGTGQILSEVDGKGKSIGKGGDFFSRKLKVGEKVILRGGKSNE
ncbi:hypothetical protein FSARC_8834 [Fusarium sarcochroum]|uniref:Glycosyl hydrolase family 95 N-terminal domain-containing protein n=1 Tax=Fusarium sarcochroum TaxID=1208366 RepID=A0A8H4X6T8_9HYPO|nr:hypothetical protein FSARC_8834 [Fusarium sarcochroum]